MTQLELDDLARETLERQYAELRRQLPPGVQAHLPTTAPEEVLAAADAYWRGGLAAGPAVRLAAVDWLTRL